MSTLSHNLSSLNLILKRPTRWPSQKIVLCAAHFFYTVGTVMAAYGSSRSSSTPDMNNETLNQAGNCIMFLVMLGILFWFWPAGDALLNARSDINFHASKYLLLAAVPCVVLQTIRLSYDMLYALTQVSVLDPITGSFAMKLYIFVIQLLIVSLALTGGWMSRSLAKHLDPYLELAGSTSGLV